MKILLSYSYAHYDPNKKPNEHKHWQSSASILARTLHDLLSKLGDVTYIDRTNYTSIIGKEFDLFVGIAENFSEIVKSCHIKRSVFFAVNMHPRERNAILKNTIQEFQLPDSAVAGWELHDIKSIEHSLNTADHILCVGNDRTVQSYTKHGIPRSKIKRINYGTLQEQTPTKKSASTTRNFLYVASEIGLRKGFDHLFEIIQDANVKKLPFTLNIIGSPSTPYYESKLSTLINDSEGKVVQHGWIDSASEKYWDLLKAADFTIFPSLEEGQAGSVIDCISAGAVPIVSENSGFDFSPLGYLTIRKSPENHSIFENACNLDQQSLEALQEHTLSYYTDFHHDFKSALSSTLNNILEGHTFPKVSVVLPIFNKEKSIVELVMWLDSVCLEYKNVELHIFFDGCKDNTEKVVRAYFRSKKNYPVTFEVTPNLFEVKTNNLGMKKSTGEIISIVQDDNYIYDRDCFFQAADVFNINPKVAVLGGLAGVNFYPRGTTGLKGNGQIACNANEVYWRQDANTDPALTHRVFQADACMRGPLFFRRFHAEKLNYLDEIYAPLYQDDMDYCFRAWEAGYQIFCSIMHVENRALTMAHYNEERNKFFEMIIKRNTDIFYSRHTPSSKKNHLWIHSNYKSKGLTKKQYNQMKSFFLKEKVKKLTVRIANKIKKELRNLKPVKVRD